MATEYQLISRFSYRDPMLFKARARLAADHLELSGWHWRGRYLRQIPLQRIVHVDVKSNRELILWLVDGEVVRLAIEEPTRWLLRISEKIAPSGDDGF